MKADDVSLLTGIKSAQPASTLTDLTRETTSALMVVTGNGVQGYRPLVLHDPVMFCESLRYCGVTIPDSPVSERDSASLNHY
jgi:hypothetical protein